MQRIICVCVGDPCDISVWSNVPFFVTRELAKYGYDIVKCDIMPSRFLIKLFQISVGRLLSLFYPDHEWNLMRTKIFQMWANFKISRVIKRSPDARLCLFFTYGFTNIGKNIPSVLLCDWTLESLICCRKKRIPYWFEINQIKRERYAIESAEYVISLFPGYARDIKLQIPEANIIKPGNIPINNILEEGIVPDTLISLKLAQNNVLFIGRKHYKSACVKLIEAIELLNSSSDKRYNLHIIGLNANDLNRDVDPNTIHFYGFLRKDVISERNLYYHLIKRATVFANPMPGWGGYSSTLEAMYYCTPILIAHYPEFASEFGDNIEFGLYTKFTPEDIANSIETIICHSSYALMAKMAHAAVRDRTWSEYVKKLILEVKL